MNNKVMIYDERSNTWNRTRKYISSVKEMQDKLLKGVGIKDD